MTGATITPQRTAARTIHERVRQIADAWPDRSGFVHISGDEQQPISWGELVRRSAQLCSFLQSRGSRPGDLVVIILRHDERLLYTFLGAMMGGLVPSILAYPTGKLDPEKYRSTMSSLMKRISPRFILTTDDLAAALAPACDAGGAEIVRTPEVDELETFPESGCIRARPDDIALLQHSSGTTGLQKGVALTHEQVINQVDHYAEALGLLDSDAVVSWLPLYHDMGLIACTMLPAMKGLPTYWMSPLEWVARPSILLDVISRERPTLCWQPNFAFSLLARRTTDTEARQFDLSSIRAWISCSEPVSAETMAAFEARFRASGVAPTSLGACYAMAENTFAVTQSEIGRPPHVDRVDPRALQAGLADPVANGGSQSSRKQAWEVVSCGRVVEGTALRVIDASGRPLPERTIGQLAISGDSVFSGYFRNDAASSQALEAGWFRTGDLGYIAAGHCYVTGRVKDLIIIAGRNIHPHDVEAVVGRVDGVIEGRVAAVGRYDAGIGTERLLVIAESRCENVERADLEARIRRAIVESLDCPVDEVVIIEPGRLLKTSSGKVARSANAQRFTPGAARP